MNLIYDQAAHTILKNNEFILKWKQLHSNCHYATAFQEPAFVSAWYEAYRDKWKPLIVFSENSNGDLKGLLLLAYDPNVRGLVHAGSSQAEYHTWISLPGEEVAFLSDAFRALLNQYDFKRLRFRYFPAVEILEQVIPKLSKKDCIDIRRRPRPLMILNAEEIKASFAKKSNKSRFNRLKKLGKVDFYRIKDIHALNSVFDELISYYDLRQGAINHSKPFHEDDNKRKFHVEMFVRAGDKAYVTVTCLDDKPIAGFWGLVSKDKVHLGMLMHSPFLAEHSIGKLHLMQLSEQLLTDGFNTLDLTPGSDPWKERFANAHDEVAEVILYRSGIAKTKDALTYRILNRFRQRADKAGITTAQLKLILSMVRNIRPYALVSNLWRWIKSDREYYVYQIDRDSASPFQRDERVQRNNLNDLLLYEAGDEDLSGNSFLSLSLQRLEEGEKVYTININSRLAYCGWMARNPTVNLPQDLPAESIILHDFYIQSAYENSEFNKAFTEHLTHEAFIDQNVQHVFVIVPARNKSYTQMLTEIGFSYKSSYIQSRKFGRETTKAS
jgi:CelD/BcsL family acetyltransferase involved in cellulose biosynthesis